MKHKKVSKKSVNSSTSNTKYSNSSYDQLSVSSKTGMARKRHDSETSGIDDDNKTERTSRSNNKISDYDSMSSRSCSQSSRSNSSECNDPEFDQFVVNDDEVLSEFNSQDKIDLKKKFIEKNALSSEGFKPIVTDDLRRNLNMFQNFQNQQQMNQFFNEFVKNRAQTETASMTPNMFLNEFFNFNQAFSMFKQNSNENGK